MNQIDWRLEERVEAADVVPTSDSSKRIVVMWNIESMRPLVVGGAGGGELRRQDICSLRILGTEV
jgi:hypothetical protein